VAKTADTSPGTAQEKLREDKAIATGADIRNEDGKLTPLEVQAGGCILFGKWSGSEAKIDDEDPLIMKETGMLGVIEMAVAKKEVAQSGATSLTSSRRD